MPIWPVPPAFDSTVMRSMITGSWSVTNSTDAPVQPARIFLRIASCSVTGENCVEAKTKVLPGSVAVAPVGAPPPVGAPVVEHAVRRIASAPVMPIARVRPDRRSSLPPLEVAETLCPSVRKRDLKNVRRSRQLIEGNRRILDWYGQPRQAAEDHGAAMREIAAAGAK